MITLAHALVIIAQLAIVAVTVWLWVKYVWARSEDFLDLIIPTVVLAFVLIYFCPTPEALSFTG